MKERKSEGAITSVILKAGIPAFFYEMKLKGPGCKVKGDDKKTPNTRKSQNRAADSSNKKSSSKKDMAGHQSQATIGKDPISESVNERKASGSILALSGNGRPTDIDVY